MVTLRKYLQNQENFLAWCLGIPSLAWIVWLIWPGFHMSPAGLHFIRQTDSLSFVLSYLERGAMSISPATLNLSSTEGKAACEFPILYYVTARLASIGFSPVSTLKTLHFIIFSAGVLFTSRLFFEVMKNALSVILSIILIFSGTILLYYSNNLLPDIPALGLTLIGVSLSVRGLLNEDKRLIIKSTWFFLFAALFKITYGIYPIAFCAAWLFTSHEPLVRKLKQAFIWSLISLAPAVVWGAFVNFYNEHHHSAYFLTTWSPIWSLNGEQINVVLDYISRYWRVNFYYPTTLHLLGIIILGTFILRIRKSNSLFSLLGWTIAGAMTYFLLFFEKFKDHDYYLLVFIPGVVILLCTLWNYEWISKTKMRFVLISCTGVIALLSMNYAGKKLDQRYNRPADQYSEISKILSGYPAEELNKIGTDENVLVLGDATMNGSLTIINRKGITVPGSKLSEAEIDAGILENEISKIVVLGEARAEWQKYLARSNRIGGWGETSIYEFIGNR